MRILHIADVHWRGLSRHQEYVLAFKDMFRQASEIKPDVIYVGGDIVHSKTQGISPELIECLCWWFNGLAEIAPTHVILGNHDGLILNKDRQDAITPIIEALDNPNIFLYKYSGTYEFAPGFEWCVLSCFDEENVLVSAGSSTVQPRCAADAQKWQRQIEVSIKCKSSGANRNLYFPRGNNKFFARDHAKKNGDKYVTKIKAGDC